MTRAELIQALRERFIRVRPEWPDIAEIVRAVSGDRLLDSHCRCTGCGGYHFTPDELVTRAAAFTDVDSFMQAMQAIALERVPAACLRETDRVHAAIVGGRN
jgi:hypothetical protein